VPVQAPVSAAARQALAAYADRIQLGVEHSTGRAREEMWNDPVTGRSRQLSINGKGQVTNQFATSYSGGFTVTIWVNYLARSWTRDRAPTGIVPRKGNSAAELVQANRDDVTNGTARIVGHETVDGEATLHLRKTVHPALPAGITLPKGAHRGLLRSLPTFLVDTWVDPLTYLPIRMETTVHGHSTVTDNSWLPRTASAIAETRVAIPTGFKQADPRQGSFDFASGTLISTRCQS